MVALPFGRARNSWGKVADVACETYRKIPKRGAEVASYTYM